jgi:hypothetical protein
VQAWRVVTVAGKAGQLVTVGVCLRGELRGNSGGVQKDELGSEAGGNFCTLGVR